MSNIKGNTGNFNAGYRNAGNWNAGDRNTGSWNTGNRNTGNFNAGDCNTGDYNTGNYNTGDWNITNYSSGIFNTEQKTIYIFDKPSNWTPEDWLSSDVRNILNCNLEPTEWIYEENMSDEEKEQHPEYKTTGGYLKEFEFKEACKNMWNRLTDDEKYRVVTELPNFDADKFELITGIEIEKNLKRYNKK